MNIQKQFEALAELEFGEIPEKCLEIHGGETRFFFRNEHGSLDSKYRNYDTDNEIDRLVRGLDKTTSEKYAFYLEVVVTGGTTISPTRFHLARMLKATTAQKREALLRATGKFISNECEKDGE